jgi:hypothetical protein
MLQSVASKTLPNAGPALTSSHQPRRRRCRTSRVRYSRRHLSLVFDSIDRALFCLGMLFEQLIEEHSNVL